ncbi:hypothetical protein [Sinosporangium siamense]|nr:hypothetical protein [Sinosporangium siamense]
MGSQGVHVVGIETAAGSKVSLPFLTREQANAVHAGFADLNRPMEPRPTSPGNPPCELCDGTGAWEERRGSATASGGVVITNILVPCELCAGTGQMPDVN